VRIDLHTHSSASDGTDAPDRVVAAAARAGLDVVALTDHDTAAGWPEASEAADRLGVELVPGIEVSSRQGGASVHLLAYWPDPRHPALAAQLERILLARDGRLPRMLARLREAGVDLDEAQVRAVAGDAEALGRPHVADAMVAAGIVADRGEAFDSWLAEGRPGYVSKQNELSTASTIALVRDAGGVPVLAHPWGRASRGALTEPVLAELTTAGLAGLEVDHQDHDPPTRDALRGIAADLGLVVTGSSDYHGAGKADHDLGCNTTSPEALAALREVRASLRAG
jgi:predicted metal-dependent phosphoesterase TrpH